MLDLFRHLFGSDNQPTQLMQDANALCLDMLTEARDLLQQIQPQLFAPEVPDELRQTARTIDKASNKRERSIRRMLVEALAFDQSDAPAGLVLMSVAKDCERLIDECRNLAEAGALLDAPLPELYQEATSNRLQDLVALLERTHACCLTNDERAAVDLVESEKPFISQLQVWQDRLLDDDGLSRRQAVALARGLRYLHRIRAHLANIASTVIFPVHQIDFAKRKFLAEAKERLGIQE